jgi:hypothetical protein
MTEQAVENTVKTFGNPPVVVKDVVDADGNTYCQVHDDVETGLRCNNCERLMCAKCAVHTPVGYRCEQCVRQLEDRFFNADQAYYIKLVGVTAVGGAIGAFIANFVGFFLFVFFIGAAAGAGISEFATRFIKGQRGRYAGEAAAAGIVLGVLITGLLFGVVYAGQISSAAQLTPQQIQIILERYDADTAQQIIEGYQRQINPIGYVTTIFFSFITRFSVLIYTAITAVTVYGRFNIYGGGKRR